MYQSKLLQPKQKHFCIVLGHTRKLRKTNQFAKIRGKQKQEMKGKDV